MKLSELMVGVTPKADFEGFVTNDDNVLAIDTSPSQNAAPGDYEVVQMGIVGLDSQMNPIEQTKQYIRAGQSTTKTGTQRTFKVTGDRYVKDPFQDYALDPARKYGVGQAVIVKYVYFCILNGKGEQGTVSIVVNSDGSGNSGENAAIDIDLKKVGAMPTDYTYTPAGTLVPITVTSIAGGTTGKTVVTASPSVPSAHTAHYKTAASVVLPAYDDVVTGWTAFVSGTEYTAVAGNDFAVVYLDATNHAKYAGKASAVIA